MTLTKAGAGLGLSIVAARGGAMPRAGLGIFVRSVVGGGAAAEDGRLQPGDQLLQVDGVSLVGVTQVRVVALGQNDSSTELLVVHDGQKSWFFHQMDKFTFSTKLLKI